MTTSSSRQAMDPRRPRRSADPAQRQPDDRQPYTAPRLRQLGDAQSLLEVLGPAQANYGGVMGP